MRVVKAEYIGHCMTMGGLIGVAFAAFINLFVESHFPTQYGLFIGGMGGLAYGLITMPAPQT